VAVLLYTGCMFSSVLVLSSFFVLYAVAHSLLASLPLKGWARHIFGSSTHRWYRLAYNLFATITLLPIVPLLALLPDRTLYVVPSPWRWVMVGGQVLALGGGGVTLLQTGLFHFLGVAQLFVEQPAESGSLSIQGFYKRVRHPLYSFSLLFLWLTPVMSVNLLTTYALFTIYFYVGSIYEERRLLAEFGPTYRDYQQRVPRLIPIPGRRY
jgi:protein-S-isoprenylcysteine O-methyltransferase Ste14